MQNTGASKNGSASGHDPRAHGAPEGEKDPHPCRPRQWICKTCRFIHEGRSLVGEVIALEYIGRRGPSAIPDYRLTIRGATGAKLTVSMFETYATIDD